MQKTKKEVAVRQSNFIAPTEYEVALPELPVDAKHVAFPFDEDVLYAYDVIHGVSSEVGTLHGLHAEFDMGVKINVMDLEAATPSAPGAVQLDPLDAFICRPEFARPAARKGAAAASSGGGAGAVAAAAGDEEFEWMLRPNYMHLDLYDAVYKHADARVTEAEANRKKIAALRARYAGPRKERILEGFAQASAAPVHPTNPRLKPVCVWSLLPDAERAGIAYVHVSFDSDPTTAVVTSPLEAAQPPLAKRARLSGSVIRTAGGGGTADGTVTVNYLVPQDPSGGTLRHSRDYHMLVDRPSAVGSAGAKRGPNAQGDEQLALLWDDASATVTYAPIRTRAALTAAPTTSSSSSSSSASSGVAVPVLPRALLEEERDAMDGLAADMTETDAQSRAAAHAEIRARRLTRLEAQRAAVESAAMGADAPMSGAGATSSSSSSNNEGGSGAQAPARTYGSAPVPGAKSSPLIDFEAEMDDEE